VTDHVKRGATKHTDREVSYEYNGIDGGHIVSVWCCEECGEPLELRYRAGNEAYAAIGCPCGAQSLDVRIADILQFEMEAWDTRTVSDLGRGEFA
jgi:hypothetical protein